MTVDSIYECASASIGADSQIAVVNALSDAGGWCCAATSGSIGLTGI